MTRPALQVDCESCGGHGSTIDRHPMDPDQIETKCGDCDDGLVDARCQICGGDDPAVESRTLPGETTPTLFCETCLVESNDVLL